MKLSVLLHDITVKETNIRDFDAEIEAITDNSEKVTPECLFVAHTGTHTDGHDYIGTAIARGAKVIVAEKKPAENCAYLVTDNTRLALAYLFSRFYGDPAKDLDLIAVTGTNGKTTVTHMLRHLFKCAGHKAGLIGTVGYIIGDREYPASLTTPDPECFYRLLSEMREQGIRYVFCEASSHSLALDKLAACRFTAGAFTNLTQDHLDFHKTVDAYLAAKCRLFPMCAASILNADDEKTMRAAAYAKGPVYTFGQASPADFYAENVRYRGMDGSEFDLLWRGERIHTTLRVPSRFNVSNALCAIATAAVSGMDVKTAAASIADFPGVRGRMERLSFDGCDVPFSVIIDFAHTPDALLNLLKAVRAAAGDGRGRIILVFGCGGDRDKTKRPLMGDVAARYADFTVITADNSRTERTLDIIDDILDGFDRTKPHRVIESRRAAIEYALSSAQHGDVVVLAGKGHEDYEIFGKEKRPFSERAIVKDYIKQKYPLIQAEDGEV